MTDYNKLKVVELKDILKERGIPSTGLSRKQQIVEALEAHDASQAGSPASGTTKLDEEVSSLTDGSNQKEALVVDSRDGTVVEQQLDTNVHDDAQGEEKEVADQDDDAQGEHIADGEKQESMVEHAKQEHSHNIGKEIDSAESTQEEGEAVVSQPQDLERLLQTSATDQPSSKILSGEPAILERGQPVSTEASRPATPPRTSSLPGSQSPDSRKRKRRSPTPPPSTDSISKKLKTAEDALLLPEDTAMSDAPAIETANRATEAEQDEATVIPAMMTDDTLAEPHAIQYAGQRESLDDNVSAPGAIHPATRALYIHDLVRPIQPQQLREHLENLAAPPNSTSAGSHVETLHLGSIRTHAFAVFTSVTAASRVRSGLHGRIWPDEPARKSLWVDFVPEEEVDRWISTEIDSGNGRRDTRRWEVVYDRTDDRVTVTHREATTSSSGPVSDGGRQSSFGREVGMPNAPAGPRGTQMSYAPSPAQPSQRAPHPRAEQPSKESFDILDKRFDFTSTRPKLYYLPVAKDLVDRRLDELDAQTSRDWEDGRGSPHDAGGFGSQMRRYTFEDGDRLVDGGPDIGSFGRRGPPPGARFRGSRYRGGR